MTKKLNIVDSRKKSKNNPGLSVEQVVTHFHRCGIFRA